MFSHESFIDFYMHKCLFKKKIELRDAENVIFFFFGNSRYREIHFR